MNFNFGKVFRTKESGASNDALKVEEALEASTLNTDENAIGKQLLLLIIIGEVFQLFYNSTVIAYKFQVNILSDIS